MRTIRIAIAAVAVVVIGCAPRSNRALERAQAAYQEAATSPDVERRAPAALHDAGEALDRAKRAWDERRDDRETNSLAYIAERRVEIAREVAAQNKADEEAEALTADRARLLRDARTARQRTHRAERSTPPGPATAGTGKHPPDEPTSSY